MLALCPRAHADSFTVTGGTITIPSAHGSATFTLTGDGFSLSGGAPQGIGSLSCFPCSSASNVTLQGPLGDISFGFGPGMFNGVSYPSIVLTGSMNVVSPSFPGSMLLTSTTVMVPFDFSATMFGYPSGADAINGTHPIFSLANFTGSGTVTAQFGAVPVSPGQTPIFDLQGAVYQFSASSASPTPEPATLMLFGIGAAATAAVRRRTRKP